MKNVSICMMSLLLLAGVALTGCKGTNEPEQSKEVKTYSVSINASKGGSNGVSGAPRKVITPRGSELKVEWAAGEPVAVFNGSTSLGTLTAQSSGKSTDLSGSLTGVINVGDKLTLKFRAPEYMAQAGTLAYISENCDYATAEVEVTEVDGSAIVTEDADFVNQQAIIKFTLKKDGGSAINPSALTISDGTNNIARLVIPAATYETNGAGIIYVAVPAVSGRLRFTASVNNEIYLYGTAGDNVSLAKGQFYQQDMTMQKTEALKGLFSVSATKKVAFSKGNLQTEFNGSRNWVFAANQWDYIGNAVANTTVGDGTVTGATGTVDLFGWSTNIKYGINNSVSDADYAGSFLDWGKNMSFDSPWRTLSSDEWNYLLYSSGRVNAENLQSCGTVNGVNGYIILPDDWSLPSGSSFTPSQGSWSANEYVGAAWTAMEDAGAVFLPCGGYREGTTVTDAGSEGYYWTATSDGSTYAYGLSLSHSQIGGIARHKGYSVRLVIDEP